MKVLHVIPEFSSKMGGPAIALKNLCQALSRLDVQQTVLSLYESDIDVEGVVVVSFNSTDRVYGYSKDLKLWLQNNISSFDLVQIHSIWLYHCYITSRMCQKFKIPYIIRLCGMLDHWSLRQKSLKKKIYLKLFENRNLKRASAVHCTSSAEVASSRISEINKNIFTSSLCIDQNLFNNGSDKKIKDQFLFLGRLHPKKQVELLLESFHEFKNLDFKLIFAGAGDDKYERLLKDKVKQFSLSEKVKFAGHVDGEEKEQFLFESDFFILPSLQENFGVAVAEAMAAGCIPIVSEAVALSKEIATSSCGIISGTNKESIIESLEKAFLMSDEEKENCRRKSIEVSSQQFRPEVVAESFLKLYKSLSHGSA
ncbi:MAG: glycosyltransferase [Lentisphaeraceae bacterium]|nr:glycosyltransferase [Lentisphaeraceae bacterium]